MEVDILLKAFKWHLVYKQDSLQTCSLTLKIEGYFPEHKIYILLYYIITNMELNLNEQNTAPSIESRETEYQEGAWGKAHGNLNSETAEIKNKPNVIDRVSVIQHEDNVLKHSTPCSDENNQQYFPSLSVNAPIPGVKNYFNIKILNTTPEAQPQRPQHGLFEPRQIEKRSPRQGPSTWEELSKMLPNSQSQSEVQKLFTCRYAGCKRITTAESLGHCGEHFTVLYNHGDIDIPTAEDVAAYRRDPTLQQQRPSCEVQKLFTCRYAGCKRITTAESLGYCSEHFTVLYNHGDIDIPTAEDVAAYRRDPKLQQKRATNVPKPPQATLPLARQFRETQAPYRDKEREHSPGFATQREPSHGVDRHRHVPLYSDARHDPRQQGFERHREMPHDLIRYRETSPTSERSRQQPHDFYRYGESSPGSDTHRGHYAGSERGSGPSHGVQRHEEPPVLHQAPHDRYWEPSRDFVRDREAIRDYDRHRGFPYGSDLQREQSPGSDRYPRDFNRHHHLSRPSDTYRDQSPHVARDRQQSYPTQFQSQHREIDPYSHNSSASQYPRADPHPGHRGYGHDHTTQYKDARIASPHLYGPGHIGGRTSQYISPRPLARLDPQYAGYGNPDLSESGESGDEEEHTRQPCVACGCRNCNRSCAHNTTVSNEPEQADVKQKCPMCNNKGDRTYNGLCPECYNKLQANKNQKLPVPLPDYQTSLHGNSFPMVSKKINTRSTPLNPLHIKPNLHAVTEESPEANKAMFRTSASYAQGMDTSESQLYSVAYQPADETPQEYVPSFVVQPGLHTWHGEHSNNLSSLAVMRPKESGGCIEYPRNIEPENISVSMTEANDSDDQASSTNLFQTPIDPSLSTSSFMPEIRYPPQTKK